MLILATVKAYDWLWMTPLSVNMGKMNNDLDRCDGYVDVSPQAQEKLAAQVDLVFFLDVRSGKIGRVRRRRHKTL